MNKDTLNRQRAVRYGSDGEAIMLTNLDKVYEEIEVWKDLKHPNIPRLYEVIDDDDCAKMYMVMELADMG
eukprot:CAMPEP_0114594270 /NCGR_PEP_ID=MMETSP0125-20121206/15896_1 /TAXON_ID=485358 ORGANISM="Aristerostoma sp., Strain ATCC 50986" /NCGR_SAMPLE_ID=MMETSP0125 /ASSEMBLY_ACC=CAM_ASM_000245 /LENGTH=69 /DNA_ID=CAMNT_0001794345 /DNA_START=102 /DNA_END=311 /DNA_ORIENTATION=+